MKRNLFATFLVLLLTISAWSQTAPVNSNANQTTRNVLNYLWDLSIGTTPGVISGQNCNHGPEIATFAYQKYIQNLANSTGKYVGMLGVDYEFMKIYSAAELSQTNVKLIEFANVGGIVTINWTCMNPLVANGNPYTQEGGRMNQLLPGGAFRNAWLARLDVIAAALTELKNNDVTVLWRPMQESNAHWFWYGTGTADGGFAQSQADFIAVWQDMYNYLTNTKGLNNLLWVFSPTGAKSWSAYPYPGNAYVDIMGGTSYNNNLYCDQDDLASYGKPVGMAELGWDSQNNVAKDNMLYQNMLQNNYPKVAYWVSWHDWDPGILMSIATNNNANTLMNHSYILTRDELPNLKVPNIALNKPVTVSSTESATYAGSKAVDGNSSTRWSSAWTDNEFMYVDLGAWYSVSKVAINWEGAYASGYKIQTSDNAVSWTDNFTTSTGDGGFDNINLSAGGRYIRLLVTKRGTSWGNSFWEFVVIGTTDTQAPSVPSGLSFSNLTTNSLTLSWNASTDNSGNVASYEIFRNGVSVGTSTTATKNITGLSTGINYTFTVKAKDAFGNQSAASSASYMTLTNLGIPKANSATPVIDGNIDAIWNNVAVTSISNIIGSISSTTDCSGTFKSLWDANNLYFLFEITDDDKRFDSGASYWEDDAVEIYIDINNDKPTTYGANDFQYAFVWNSTAKYETKHGATTGVLMAQANPSSTTYRIEVKIPWSTMGISSMAGNVLMGLDVMIGDDDAGGSKEGKRAWVATVDNSWQNPSMFGTAWVDGATLKNASISELSGIIKTEPQIAVYPNPVTGNTLSIDLVNSPIEKTVLEIIDIRGMIIQQQDIFNRLTEVPVDFGSGIYVVRIIARDKIYTRKFIKTK